MAASIALKDACYLTVIGYYAAVIQAASRPPNSQMGR